MATATPNRELMSIPVNKVIKNPKNPRNRGHFTEKELESLTKSIERYGILDPLIVQRFNDDDYLLIEGERRFTVANNLKLAEIPAMIVERLSDHDQVVVMFNVHAQRRGWEVAEELRAIQEIREHNGHLSDEETARQLGISLGTYRDRLRVLKAGDDVLDDIATEKVDYSSVLRATQAASSIAKNRPSLTAKVGGEKAVEAKLLEKAKSRPSKKGISQELVEIKRDLADADVPDDLVAEYLDKPSTTLREVRKSRGEVEEKRKVEDLAKELKTLERDIRAFDVNLATAPNLRELRRALATLIDAAQSLEEQVVKTERSKKTSDE